MNKGSVIKYNSLNLPTKLEISNTKVRGEINYTYSASGAKLRTVHKEDISMTKMPVVGTGVYTTPEWDITTTDYVGNKVYEQVNNGERVPKRILIDGGYYDVVKNKYFYYLTDHLGNNRMVAEDNGNVIQHTHYYPFGMAFPEAKGKNEQAYKYNGKEQDTRLGLNLYDYSARYMDNAIGRFTSVDPLAKKYYSWSPYAYVMNNPLIYIDPDGRLIQSPYGGIASAFNMSPSYTQNVANTVSSAVITGRARQLDDKLTPTALTITPLSGSFFVVGGAINITFVLKGKDAGSVLVSTSMNYGILGGPSVGAGGALHFYDGYGNAFEASYLGGDSWKGSVSRTMG